MVLDHNLLYLYRRMTRITFEDGKIVMRDGKVGTEEECKCKCLTIQLLPLPDVLGWDVETWEDCASLMYDHIKTNMEAAGWTVTVTTEDREVDGVTLIYPTLSAECSECCFDCDAFYEIQNSINVFGDGGLDDQPEGAWIKAMEGGFECNGGPGVPGGSSLLFGTFRIGGCCQRFSSSGFYGGPWFFVPLLVNGEGNEDGTTIWLPACSSSLDWCNNPLP